MIQTEGDDFGDGSGPKDTQDLQEKPVEKHAMAEAFTQTPIDDIEAKMKDAVSESMELKLELDILQGMVNMLETNKKKTDELDKEISQIKSKSDLYKSSLCVSYSQNDKLKRQMDLFTQVIEILKSQVKVANQRHSRIVSKEAGQVKITTGIDVSRDEQDIQNLSKDMEPVKREESKDGRGSNHSSPRSECIKLSFQERQRMKRSSWKREATDPDDPYQNNSSQKNKQDLDQDFDKISLGSMASGISQISRSSKSRVGNMFSNKKKQKRSMFIREGPVKALQSIVGVTGTQNQNKIGVDEDEVVLKCTDDLVKLENQF